MIEGNKSKYATKTQSKGNHFKPKRRLTHKTQQSFFQLRFPLYHLKLSNSKSFSIKKKYSFEDIYYNIDLIENEALIRESSMLTLFNSNKFTIELLIRYLFSQKSVGVCDYLVNLLGRKFLDYSLFYIPQICAFLQIRTYSDSLKQLLLDNCVDHLKFGIFVHWILSSMDQPTETIDKFGLLVEEMLVNGKRHHKFEVDVFKKSIDKKHRNEYIEKVKSFFELLQALCLKMKTHDVAQRPKMLAEEISNLNKFINTKNDSDDLILRGVILPFCLNSLSIDDKDNDLIMNIIPEYSFCFQTKARVPIKIVVECIKASEQVEEFIPTDTKAPIDWEPMSIISDTFGENWNDICKKLKTKSIYHRYETYSVKAFIAKANDDLRQEAMVMQLIKLCDNIFKEGKLSLKLHPYEIIITSNDSGLIEVVPNAISIDSLKKKFKKHSLEQIFKLLFPGSIEAAKKNFAESLAAYCLITYLFEIKDRHNGNILLDSAGNIVHIDFGFVLGISPGGISFEKAPFKLLSEYTDILGGSDSFLFEYYKGLMTKGFTELRKNMKKILLIVKIMKNSCPNFPCFKAENIIGNLTDKFKMPYSDFECYQYINDLVSTSKDSAWTYKYDQYQYITNSIYY